MRTPQLSLFASNPQPASSKQGAVYTKPWAVALLLDLAGYTEDRDLGACLAVEPAAGEGAFLLPMVERLLRSLSIHQRLLTDAKGALLAYELHPESAQQLRLSLLSLLAAHHVNNSVAEELAASWLRVGDYLAAAPRLPRAQFVLGNPPYVRLEEMSKETNLFLRANYATMRGRADLYIAFYEAALLQLQENGVCAFLCADRWMSNQYGAALRQLISEQASVETVVSMHDAEPFQEEVNAYPAVTVLRKAKSQGTVVAQLQKSPTTTAAILAFLQQTKEGKKVAPPAGLMAQRIEAFGLSSEPWLCLNPAQLELLQYLESEFLLLDDPETKTQISIGVASGKDQVFVTQDQHLVEAERLLPMALASDTTSGTLQWSGHYLVNPWDQEGLVDLARFPRLNGYFRQHEQEIRSRYIAKSRPAHWYRTIDRVHLELLKTPKLYLPDIKDTPNPVLDKGTTYPHHNLYVIWSSVWDLEVLGGLLLSEVGRFFVASYGVRMRGGWLRFQAQYLRRIRVPRPNEISATVAEELREAFRKRDVARATKAARAAYRLPDHLQLERINGACTVSATKFFASA
jgi:adenine-specific DNA-methyltransferase